MHVQIVKAKLINLFLLSQLQINLHSVNKTFIGSDNAVQCVFAPT